MISTTIYKERGDHLNKREQDFLLRTEKFVQQCLAGDSSGHDWWHIHRVRQMTLRLAAQERADSYVCELAALLHDVADEKLNDSKEGGLNKVRVWLEQNQLEPDQIEHVLEIISTLSFNGGSNPPMRTIEGRVVQDADRLDALGAVGIARTFAYAGYKGHIVINQIIGGCKLARLFIHTCTKSLS
ncbi:HD domain-containing protein [Paenibacillus sp. N10]|uniref:HD domain-containing protein n=1 Tax=Paenibacillus lutrae TaxID=2078573 RepID=A0A7X3FEM0_9BACL|nr:HD domain-containing protein [Paenibacillus lutrae]